MNITELNKKELSIVSGGYTFSDFTSGVSNTASNIWNKAGCWIPAIGGFALGSALTAAHYRGTFTSALTTVSVGFVTFSMYLLKKINPDAAHTVAKAASGSTGGNKK